MDKKQEILKVAIRLFETKGSHRVSIRDVAHELNMSSGNFAYHFKNMSEVMDVIIAEKVDRPMQLILNQSSSPSISELKGLITSITNLKQESLFFFRDLFLIKDEYPSIETWANNTHLATCKKIKSLLISMQNEGYLHSVLFETSVDQLAESTTRELIYDLAFQKQTTADTGSLILSTSGLSVWRQLLPYFTPLGIAYYLKHIR